MIKVVASDALAPDTAIVYSGPPSAEGELEIQRRAAAGEDFGTVYAEVMVRERRAVKIVFTPGAAK
jgi:hypothetical protein